MLILRVCDFLRVPGIGRVQERCLEALGVYTCGDIIKQRAVRHFTLNIATVFIGIYESYDAHVFNTTVSFRSYISWTGTSLTFFELVWAVPPTFVRLVKSQIARALGSKGSFHSA